MATFNKQYGMKSVEGGNLRKTQSGKYVAEQNVKVDGKWKIRRKTFETETEAENHLKTRLEEREKHGVNLLALNEWEIADFKESLALMKREGMDSIKIVECVRYYLERNKHNLMQWTVKEAIEKRLADMERRNLRPDSITGTRKILEMFQKDFATKQVRELTEDEISKWIVKQNGGERRMKNIRNELSTLFNFVEANLNEYTNIVCKPVIKSKAKIEDSKHAEIMTPKETEMFMQYLEKNYPQYCASFALMFFAGIRPNEITRTNNPLMWEDINLDEANELGGKGVIYLKSKTAKIRKGRKLPITKNLYYWLNTYKQDSGKIGKAYSGTSEVRRKAWQEVSDKEWIQDYPRHTYATCSGEVYNLHKSAQWMGHTGGIRMYVEHYQGLTTQAKAKEYFNILPAKAIKEMEELLDTDNVKASDIKINDDGVTFTKTK